MKKNLLITGGNGFLASYIIKSLLSANIYYKLNLKIICLVRNKTSKLNRLKSIKNRHEIGHMIEAHKKDGLALTKFIYWIKI